VAQDSGSAITGPARADIYYGAGAEAGRVSGRFRNNMRFVILVPRSLDPVAKGRKMPLPDARPSARIAKLFPQLDPLGDQPNDHSEAARPAQPSTPAQPVTSPAPALATAAATTPPLPRARPDTAPDRDADGHPPVHRSRRQR
jgi:membrane-bound lytic murein transglycosylase A